MKALIDDVESRFILMPTDPRGREAARVALCAKAVSLARLMPLPVLYLSSSQTRSCEAATEALGTCHGGDTHTPADATITTAEGGVVEFRPMRAIESRGDRLDLFFSCVIIEDGFCVDGQIAAAVTPCAQTVVSGLWDPPDPDGPDLYAADWATGDESVTDEHLATRNNCTLAHATFCRNWMHLAALPGTVVLRGGDR